MYSLKFGRDFVSSQRETSKYIVLDLRTFVLKSRASTFGY